MKSSQSWMTLTASMQLFGRSYDFFVPVMAGYYNYGLVASPSALHRHGIDAVSRDASLFRVIGNSFGFTGNAFCPAVDMADVSFRDGPRDWKLRKTASVALMGMGSNQQQASASFRKR
jgi:hypothetical protein